MIEDEVHARHIITLMKINGLGASEVMMRSDVLKAFLEANHFTKDQFEAGLRFARSQGWLTLGPLTVLLTAKGASL